MNAKRTASLLILAAVLANVAFTALGSIFNYPDVLDEPAGQVLASFREHEGAVSAWFTVLALSAALLAPIAIGVGRLSSARAMRIAVPVGIAAATVQVIGLMRWPILVPGYASSDNRDAFSTASDVLDEPAGDVLASFRDHEGAVRAWFAVLALSAALLAPIAIGVGRLSSTRAMRVAVWVGIAAAAVQVIGLLRWPILVPGYASDAASGDPAVAAGARDSFTTASDILGTAIGETLGYLLTATWTVLVVVALGRRFACRWFSVLGLAAAGLVAVGVLSPLDLPVVDTANFFGYILWSVWLIAFGVLILRRERATAATRSTPDRAAAQAP